MRRSHRIIAGLLALGLVSGGCYGPFQLTRKVWRWNGQVSENKWVVEAVFLACSFFPVYSAAATLDGLLFNSIEFWTGTNPISASTGSATQQRTRIAAGDSYAIVTRTAEGAHARLLIEQFDHGQPSGTLRIEQHEGMTVASNAVGEPVLNAQTLPDGSILITDAKGHRVAFYSARQVQKLTETARR